MCNEILTHGCSCFSPPPEKQSPQLGSNRRPCTQQQVRVTRHPKPALYSIPSDCKQRLGRPSFHLRSTKTWPLPLLRSWKGKNPYKTPGTAKLKHPRNPAQASPSTHSPVLRCQNSLRAILIPSAIPSPTGSLNARGFHDTQGTTLNSLPQVQFLSSCVSASLAVRQLGVLPCCRTVFTVP